jgi:lipopolysaccharide export system protein LptA
MNCNVITRGPVRATVGALLIALAALFGAAASAETADKQKPIVWSADQDLTGNSEQKVFTLSKNVIVSQGTTLIHADRVDGKQNADSSMSATAYGNPVSFRTKSDGVDEFKEAYAKKIIYDGQTGIIELFDNALLKDGKNELRGNHIKYDTRTGKFLTDARPDAPGETNGPGNRVRGVFMPREDDSAPGKDDAKDKAGKAPAKGGKAAAKDATPASSTAPAATSSATSAPAASDTAKAAPKTAQSPPVPLQSDTELKSAQ